MPSGRVLSVLSGALLVLQACSQQTTSLSSSALLTSTSIASDTATSNVNNITAAGATSSLRSTPRTTQSVTEIGGRFTSSRTSSNATTATSSSAQPTNTVPCNGFPEFCNRKYSNITNVCSHNSAFVVPNNVASNQMLPLVDQLNDGIRMLQGETQYVNDTIYNCHTSCDLLNAGTWQLELETVAQWLQANPYDVLTILIGNSDQTAVQNYVAPIENAGLLRYVYTPASVPQPRDQWPTLGEMILRNQRLVFFMDYNADQSAVPYIIDQYSHLLQTPFSPTDRSFPCTIDYPTGVNETEFRENYMYLANHNLNQAIDLSSILGSDAGTILVPNTAELNTTNGQGLQYGELGAMSSNCTKDWNRPPNFLVVDYYNRGSPEAGSVFHVAAQANGVTYTKPCCGLNSRITSSTMRSSDAAVGLMLCLIAAVVYLQMGL